MTKTHTNILGYQGVVREITSLLRDYGLNFSTFKELFWLSMGVKPKPETQILSSGFWLKPDDNHPNLFTKLPHEDIYFDFYFDFNGIPFISLQALVKKLNILFPGADAEVLIDWTKGRRKIIRSSSNRVYLDTIRIESSKVFIYMMPKIIQHLEKNTCFLDGRFNYSSVSHSLAQEVCQLTDHSIDRWRGTNLIFDALCLFANVHFYKTQNFFAHKEDSANLLGLSVKGKADLKEIEGSDLSMLSLDCDTSQLLNLKRLFDFYSKDLQTALCGNEEKGNFDCMKVPNKVFMLAPFMRKLRSAITQCFKEHELRYKVQLAFYDLEQEKLLNSDLPLMAPKEEKSEFSRKDLVLEKFHILKSRAYEAKSLSRDEFVGILQSIDLILNPPLIENKKKKSLISCFWRKSEPILPFVPICPQLQGLNQFLKQLMNLQVVRNSPTQELIESKQDSEPSLPSIKF